MYNPSDPESIKRLVKAQIKSMIENEEIEFSLSSETRGSRGSYTTVIKLNVIVDDDIISSDSVCVENDD